LHFRCQEHHRGRAESREKVDELRENFHGDFYLAHSAFRAFVEEAPGATVFSSVKPAYFYLLSDVVLVAKSKTSHKIAFHVYLYNAKVSPLPENPASKWSFGFRITTARGFHQDLLFDYDKECEKWAELVRKQIDELPALLDKNASEKASIIAMSNLPLDATKATSDEGSQQKKESGKPEDAAPAKQAPRARAAPAAGKGRREGEDAAVKEIMTVCKDIVKIEEEIVAMPINLRTLYPQFYAQLPPDQLARMKTRLQMLATKLNEVAALHARAGQAMKTQKVFLDLDTLVMDGEKSIMAMKRFIFAAFPKRPGQAPLPKSRDPQLLLRYIFAWYVKLCEAWINVTDIII